MIFALLTLFICFLLSYAQASIMVDVIPGKSRCVGQELDDEDMAIFLFGGNHVPATSQKQIEIQKEKKTLSVSIQDPEGTYLLSNEKVPIGAPRPKEYKMPSISKRGVYDLCFELTGGNTPIRAYFHVDFKSRNSPGALDSSSTQLEHKEVPAVQQKLMHAEHLLEVIQQEINYAKDQEKNLKESGKNMSDKIQWFSLLSMAVLLITSLWQLLYLRSFFTSKKLL